MDNIKLGGFIITYNRSEILRETISKVFAQSFPPEQIWIIDNSEDDATLSMIISLQDGRIKYFKMGFNAGPAGGAAKGLELCFKDGFDWIYWGDDNDPPFRNDCFERLLAIRNENPYCGILGVVGHFFDRKKGEIKRIQSRLLEKKEVVEVDCIAGGMSMLVSSKVVESGVFPDNDLFFGFEELDFCLKAKRKGFSSLVDCKLFLKARQQYNKIDYERPLYRRKDNLIREYYSLRNLLYISDSLTSDTMKKRVIIKGIGKIFYGFRYGFRYGLENFKYISLALIHYNKNLKGKL